MTVKDNNNNNQEEQRASFSSNLSQFDQFSHNQSSTYVKIIRKVNKTWLFYETMQLISHRIDIGKIKGPLADYLNNNEKFWILDNKKSTQ